MDAEKGEMILWTMVVFGLTAIHEGILGPAVVCFRPNHDVSNFSKSSESVLLTTGSSWGCGRALGEWQCN